MIERFPEELCQEIRNRAFEGDIAVLYQHLGLFINWFSVAELWVTNILLWLLRQNDIERANYLLRGMDARVKCERLRQAAKAYNPLGPYLSNKLNIFEVDCIPTRNNISHSWPYLNQNTKIINFNSLANFPDPHDPNPPKNLSKKDGIHLDDLFSQSMWLNAFADDVLSALTKAKYGEPLEVDESRMNQPPEVP